MWCLGDYLNVNSYGIVGTGTLNVTDVSWSGTIPQSVISGLTGTLNLISGMATSGDNTNLVTSGDFNAHTGLTSTAHGGLPTLTEFTSHTGLQATAHGGITLSTDFNVHTGLTSTAHGGLPTLTEFTSHTGLQATAHGGITLSADFNAHTGLTSTAHGGLPTLTAFTSHTGLTSTAHGGLPTLTAFTSHTGLQATAHGGITLSTDFTSHTGLMSTAHGGLIPLSLSGVPNGFATLDSSGYLTGSQFPTGVVIQLRRGTNSERLSFVPAEGEAVWTTDKKRLYVGDGATSGGNVVGGCLTDEKLFLGDNNESYLSYTSNGLSISVGSGYGSTGVISGYLSLSGICINTGVVSSQTALTYRNDYGVSNFIDGASMIYSYVSVPYNKDFNVCRNILAMPSSFANIKVINNDVSSKTTFSSYYGLYNNYATIAGTFYGCYNNISGNGDYYGLYNTVSDNEEYASGTIYGVYNQFWGIRNDVTFCGTYSLFQGLYDNPTKSVCGVRINHACTSDTNQKCWAIYNESDAVAGKSLLGKNAVKTYFGDVLPWSISYQANGVGQSGLVLNREVGTGQAIISGAFKTSVNNTTPLDVNNSGVVKLGALSYNFSIKTTDYVVTSTDCVVVGSSASNLLFTLPSGRGGGQVYTLKNIGVGTLTISGVSSTIDGVVSTGLSPWQHIQVIDYANYAWGII